MNNLIFNDYARISIIADALPPFELAWIFCLLKTAKRRNYSIRI